MSRARAVGTRELEAWPGRVQSAAADPELGAEVAEHARAALGHLEAGRWDDARAAAELCLELGAEAGGGAAWREFSLLVEEAAETGRALL